MLDAIYGIRVVSESRKELPFDGFEGIVITSAAYSYSKIEFVKMVKTSEGYYTQSSVEFPLDGVLNSVTKNVKEKVEYLYKKAKEFAEDEEIAISDNLISLLAS